LLMLKTRGIMLRRTITIQSLDVQLL